MRSRSRRASGRCFVRRCGRAPAVLGGAPSRPLPEARTDPFDNESAFPMADEGDILTDINPDPAANGADTAPAAGIISQYIKDLSVENPNAPASYQWEDAPQVDLQMNIGAVAVNEEIHEVELKLNVTAKGEKGNVYLIELAYCALVGMRNLPQDQAHAFLYAEAPRIIFPFARRIVADASRDLGYQPLVLDPIDFTGLYAQRLQQRQAEGADPTEMAPAPGGDA